MALQFQAKWDGQALWPVSQLDKLAKITAQTVVTCQVSMRRSAPHHRRTFGIIGVAFDNWPKSHEFQPETDDELRSWLTIKAGHGSNKSFTLPADAGPIECARVSVLALAEAKQHKHPIIKAWRDRIVVWHADSLAWDKLDQRAFAPIAQAIEEIICAETGLKPADLEKEAA